VTHDHVSEQWSNVVTHFHVVIRSDAPGGPVQVSRPRREFADLMTDDVTGGRTVVTSPRARSSVRDLESSARLAVTYPTRGMGSTLTGARSLPGIRRRLSSWALRGIQRALRSSAIPTGVSSILCGAVIGTRRSHGNLLRFDSLIVSRYRITIPIFAH
jgi:hypothetical protein